MLKLFKKRLQKLLFRTGFYKIVRQDAQNLSFDDAGSDQRSFDRYQIAFPVRVSGKDAKDQDFQEITQLRDVSGSGALFLSKAPQYYFPGQQLKVSILLDTAEDVRACISNKASVVRIHPPAVCEAEDGNLSQGIAVTFNHAFDFQRMASEENGCD